MLGRIRFYIWKAIYLKRKKQKYRERIVYNRIYALDVHKRNILPYMNKFTGRSIAIFGSGPTLKCYKPQDENLINIGVNNTYLNKEVEFDFLFAQEISSEIDMENFLDYRRGKCKKFLGIISDTMYEYMKDYSKRYRVPSSKRIPIKFYSNPDVVAYILEELVATTLPYNIGYEPFGDWHGSVFSALQFALYTNPKRIYIVGNDCSVGHFTERQKNSRSNFTANIIMWKKMKEYIDEYYPDIEVISVNPVGLKGLFKDVYTKEYLEQ